MSLPMDIAHPGFRIDSPLKLGAEDVHVWRLDLASTAAEEEHWSAILSSDEQARAARFHFRIDRQYFAVGRAFLRQILGAYLASNPKELVFTYSPKNKPSLAGAHLDGDLAFNISHSGEIALLAFARGRQVGVDVEQVKQDFDSAAIAMRFFSTAEQQQLAALPVDQRHEAFFRCWTRKEAYIKATGEGLSLPLHQFDVSLVPRAQNALLATRPDKTESKRWSLRDIAVRPGYAGALCVSGTDWKLIDWSGKEVTG